MDAAPNVQIDFRGYNAGSLFRFLPRSTDFSSAGGPASPAASLPSPQCAALSTAHGIISKLASELDQHSLGSISLTHGADDLDARGRSPMCRQSSRPSLGGEAGGRSLGFISLISSAERRRARGNRRAGHLPERHRRDA
jgi:hypothetical protein